MSEHRTSFETTSWSRLLRIARDEPRGDDRDLAELCRGYWFPLYALLRRSGISAADAEDTVQGFFEWLLTSDLFRRADPLRGRFRDLLRAALKQFQAREFRRVTAKKRHPGSPVLSLNLSEGESRFETHRLHAETAEASFEREWALAAIDAAMSRLQSEMQAAGKKRQFEVMNGMLTGQNGLSGRELAAMLGVSEGAARVALHRVKRRYGELLRLEIAATVGDSVSVDEEIRNMVAALSN